jgi:hypothetical protein
MPTQRPALTGATLEIVDDDDIRHGRYGVLRKDHEA